MGFLVAETVSVLLALLVSCLIYVCVGMTANELTQIVDFHNNVRRGEGSSNMQAITWSPTLAIFAQNWSNLCTFQRGQGVNASTLQSLGLSQSLYARDASIPALPSYLAVATQLWLAEKTAYSYANNTCAVGHFCGHYIKSVWATTSEIGCAYKICSPLNPFTWTNGLLFICFYASRADYDNQVPYLKGPPCTQCAPGVPKCNNRLCDKNGDAVPTLLPQRPTVTTPEVYYTTRTTSTDFSTATIPGPTTPGGPTALPDVVTTAASSINPPHRGLTPAERNEIVDYHNALRRGEGSSNMQMLAWNSTLANIAQNWSDGCNFARGQGINLSTLESLGISQSLYATTPPLPVNLSETVQFWFDEKNDYSYTNNICATGEYCGHYKKIVWANTSEIGCAYTICSPLNPFTWTSGLFLVCYYASRADYDDQVPFVKGTPCTQCAPDVPKCNNGLCDIFGDDVPTLPSENTSTTDIQLYTTQPSSSNPPDRGLTPDEQKDMVAYHNALRRSEGSSNMQILTWTSNLANMAQNWSNGCNFARGQGINSSTLEFLGISQSLYATTPPLPVNLSEAVQFWFDEKNDYSYTNNTCAGEYCGHYKKIVWATASAIGCAYKICSPLNPFTWTSGLFLVCYYASSSDYDDDHPFVKGPACSQCPVNYQFCNDGLCDSSMTISEAPSSFQPQTTSPQDFSTPSGTTYSYFFTNQTTSDVSEFSTFITNLSSPIPQQQTSTKLGISSAQTTTSLTSTKFQPVETSRYDIISSQSNVPSSIFNSQTTSGMDISTPLTNTNFAFVTTRSETYLPSLTSQSETTRQDTLSPESTSTLPAVTSQLKSTPGTGMSTPQTITNMTYTPPSTSVTNHSSPVTTSVTWISLPPTTTSINPYSTVNGSGTTSTDRPRARDCYALKQLGVTLSGVYQVWLSGSQRWVNVYCDMVTDGGGWTVLQRRLSFQDFYLGWIFYTYGFGNLEQDFWLGNENVFVMLDPLKTYSLRVDLTDFNVSSHYAVYNNFRIASSSDKYRLLSLGNYTGTAGDAMSVSVGFRFSTFDSDNDVCPDTNSAVRFHGAWWYVSADFTYANLNGFYYGGRYTSSTNDGVTWIPFKGASYSLMTTEMKFRSNSA